MPLLVSASTRLARQHAVRAAVVARRAASSSSGAPSQATVRRNAVVAGTLLVASAAIYYWESVQMGVIPSMGSKEPTFTMRYRTGGGVEEKTFTRKSAAELEAMFHEHEASTSISRKGNPVVRWDTNHIASNEPCEDRSAADVVPRGPPRTGWWGPAPKPSPEVAEGQRDLVLFSVIDGHAGDATSKLLSRTLHPTVTVALAGLQAGIVPGKSWFASLSDTLTWAKTWSPNNVARTIQTAFVQLDDNICWTPIRSLPALLKAGNEVEARGEFVALASPATAGAVVASALVDVENKSVYAAGAGDVRIVAGWQKPDGSWRSDTLTEDQMGENPREVARMRSEHPSNEADTVIRNGRVQGGLQPTRAFGDAMYKWTSLQSAAVGSVFRAEGQKERPSRPWNITPPYVTACPEVVHRTLDQGGEKLRFLVIATDGLWDRLTSEEATQLVASYLVNPKRPDVSKIALTRELPIAATEPRPYPVQDMPGQGKNKEGHWAFEGDSNVATHLIRNALGGADRKTRGELLSLHGKVSRYFRDDITVQVVFFDQDE